MKEGIVSYRPWVIHDALRRVRSQQLRKEVADRQDFLERNRKLRDAQEFVWNTLGETRLTLLISGYFIVELSSHDREQIREFSIDFGKPQMVTLRSGDKMGEKGVCYLFICKSLGRYIKKVIRQKVFGYADLSMSLMFLG